MSIAAAPEALAPGFQVCFFCETVQCFWRYVKFKMFVLFTQVAAGPRIQASEACEMVVPAAVYVSKSVHEQCAEWMAAITFRFLSIFLNKYLNP